MNTPKGRPPFSIFEWASAQALKAGKPPMAEPGPGPSSIPEPIPFPEPQPCPTPSPSTEPIVSMRTLRLSGTIPPETWNRLGTKILPKLRSGTDLKIGLDFEVSLPADAANALAVEVRQILQELGLSQSVNVE